MYLKIGKRIINASRLVHAHILEDDGEVVLTMTGGEEIRLQGEDAKKFLVALPTYEPVTEEE